jgi:LmbE family N-acetylglucosaminyl deacetylase
VGTILRLKEKYDVHVIDFTRGERGLGEAGYRDGSTARLRTAEEEAVCRELGVTLHWCSAVDGEAFADRASCEQIAAIFRTLKPRAIIAHWLLETHKDHLMSAAAAIKATQLAGIAPEIYFQEQEIQSRAFPATYYVDVSDSVEIKRKVISLYKCQNGPSIAERKLATARTNALRIWGSCGRSAEVFGVFPGTIGRNGGIFDSLERVSR